MILTRWNNQPTSIRRIAFSEAEQAITCLAILLEYQGYIISASEIRQGRPLSHCQYEGITELAGELGFSLIESTISDLRSQGSTCLFNIVDLKDQGPVVLIVKGKSLWINNPYTGITRVTDMEQQRRLLHCRGLSFDPKIMRTRLKRKKPSMLWSLLLSDKSLYSVGAAVVLLSLIHGLVALLDPIIKNVFFTNVVQMGMGDWARTLSILYFLVAVAGGILLLSVSALSLMLTNRLALKWSFNTYSALLRLPLSYLNIRSRGDLMNRVRLSEQLGSFIGSDEIMLVGSTMNLVLLFIVLLSTSVPLALMLLLIQLLSLFFVVSTNGGWKTRSERLQQQSALETGSFVNLVSNVQILRQQKMSDNAFRVHQLVVNRRTRAQQEMSLYTVLVHFGSTSIDTLQSVVLLTMAALLIMDGQITLGEYVAFQAILGSVIAPLKQIANFISNFQTLRATHERILDIIEESSLQEKQGIGDKLGTDFLLDLKILESSKSDPQVQNLQTSPIASLVIARNYNSTCLIVKSEEQKNYFEAAVGGEHLLSRTVQMNIAHKDGSRELLIARSRPYLYPGSIKDNITLGFSSAEYSAIKDYRAIMELVGWAPERLEDSIGELAEDELELKRLSIARALWRGPSGLVVSDLDKSVDGQRRTSLIKLVNRLSDMPISMVFITTEQAINVGAWSQVLEISSIVEAMMATDQEGLK